MRSTHRIKVGGLKFLVWQNPMLKVIRLVEYSLNTMLPTTLFHIFSLTRYCSSNCFMIPQEASAAISGADVYGKLKFESGIHRVQVFHTPNLSAF